MSRTTNMHPARKLDFLVIGAQKSGTTSLFHYLADHPRIYMPKSKEAAFFDKEEPISNEKIKNYFNEYFSVDSSKLLGKVTPSYLSSPVAARNIQAQMPRVRLIAMLRNPIDRAYSHYKMMVRRGYEHRPFEDAVNTWLYPESIELARNFVPGTGLDEVNCCLVWGEYYRCLVPYFEIFSKEQIKIIFFEEFTNKMDIMFDEILNHICLESGYRPKNFGNIYI